jgi:hypothetical protein
MESRFGATPVPGKIGMAMAGSNYGVPPPRPTHHGPPGNSGNPGNQLYVGNVCFVNIEMYALLILPTIATLPSGLAGS